MVFCPPGEEHGVGACSELSEVNPAASQILDLLAADIRYCPERLRAVDSRLLTWINSLVGHVDVDLNAPLLADDE
jgi:antitoxin PrlF